MPQTKAKEDLLIVEELQVDTLKLDDVEVTASAAELNKMDGVTASTAELNLGDKEAQTLTDTGAITVSGAIGDGIELLAYGGNVVHHRFTPGNSRVSVRLTS